MDALILDCDGVLVDSELLSCGAWLPVLQRPGISASLSEITSFIGQPDRSVVLHFEHLSGESLDDTIMTEREEEYFTQATGQLRSFPGCEQVLERLTQKSIPLAVASSGRPTKIRFNLEQVKLKRDL
jgi:beta-phosphoglucomutase-like phosphatase (HAD superfamily)